MKLTSRRRSRRANGAGVTGPARLGRRTRVLARRLRPGDIALIDHVDMDRSAAVALVEAQVAAVVNVAPSISGRYPNLGPEVLVAAGIPLLDDVGAKLFGAVNDGDLIRVDGDTVYVDDRSAATGVRQDADSVAAAMKSSRDSMASQLEAFSANAVEHLHRDQRLLLDGEGLPTTKTSFDGRHVVVVLRTFDYTSDLRGLRMFIRENRPVLVGVDAGADALIEAGYRPDVVVTSGDDISEAALRGGSEVIGHTSNASRSGGLERLERLAVTHQKLVASGSSEDAALLLANANNAALIVMVGSHATLVELLDKGRSGMASSFLTRSTVGSRLVDAKAVARLYHHRIRGWLVFCLVLLGVAAVVAAVATTPVGQDWWVQVRAWFDDAASWARERTR
ncbi:MAG: hypothetical protein H0U61_05345 [Nocardioidaceae bacterium]|nr:hypothetical protein [Nocardioidaceae bacterium]